MALRAPVGGSGKSKFTPAPKGEHLAICIWVLDLGTQKNFFEPEKAPKHQIYLKWEFPTLLNHVKDDDGNAIQDDDGNDIIVPFSIARFYTLSSHKKARLRGDLEEWYGQEFDDDALKDSGGFDVQKLLGRPGKIKVVHVKKTDGTVVAKIKSIEPVDDDDDCPNSQSEPLYLELTDDGYDPEVFEKITEGMQSIIKKSPEWMHVTGEHGLPPDAMSQEGAAGFTDEEYAQLPEDDVPF